MTQDLQNKSDQDIQIWIANHEKKGVTNTDLYQALVEEFAHRQGRGLDIDKSLAHLTEAAKSGNFTTYGALAEASNVPWTQARHAMNGAGGHLDNLLSICHARGLPLLPAICVNQGGQSSGELGPEALKGFAKGAQCLGYSVVNAEAFLRQCQNKCFEWAHPIGNH